MHIKKISIFNYKSIDQIELDLTELSDRSQTYGLIGVNEAGKSSILRAISLKDGTSVGDEDFRDNKPPIAVTFLYSVDSDDLNKLAATILSNTEETEEISEVRTEDLSLTIEEAVNQKRLVEIRLKLDNIRYIEVSYSFTDANIPPELYFEFQNSKSESLKNDSLGISLLSSVITDYIVENIHKTILWRAESRFLINEPVNLVEFADNPESNIPLRNCFRLAGFKENSDIKNAIESLTNNPSKIKQLQEKLKRIITNHIKKVWVDHPIEITFLIHGAHISFLVDDTETDSEDELSKTASQRSDGFRQFVSFLLTLSAENANEELKNVILLLDEPETHLHPKAQQLILNEFINLTSNDRKNIVLFATHSNFLIDKTVLDRNFKIFKKNNNTESMKIPLQDSSYLSVNFEVFGIISEDYHSELYSRLHLKFLEDNPTENSGLSNFDTRFFHQEKKLPQKYPEKDKKDKVTLCTYVRNYIHHKAECDYEVNESELTESINLMKSYLN